MPATAAGAAAGAFAGGVAGGIIGGLTSSGIPERDAHFYAEGVRRGGTLVTAKVEDALAPEAEAILKRSNWVDPTERRVSYDSKAGQDLTKRSILKTPSRSNRKGFDTAAAVSELS